MLHNNRIFWSDNATLRDLSPNLNEVLSGSEVIPFVAAEDYLFIGSDLPFNHRYIDVKVVNDEASVASVALWNGSSWESAVDVIDQTALSGKTLARSGIISWVPDRRKSWSKEYSTENIAALSSLRIYDLYWVRIAFSADIKATTEINYVGHRFSNDTDLFGQYADLDDSDLLDAFDTGKTTWNDQALIAAEYIVQDLREMGIVCSKNQILDWQVFKNASVHKTAEIIYRNFGKDYLENMQNAKAAYKASLQVKAYNADQNQNATLDEGEKIRSQEFLTR